MTGAFQEIFGKRNQSSIWVCLRDEKKNLSVAPLTFRKGQVIFVFSLSGKTMLNSSRFKVGKQAVKGMTVFEVDAEQSDALLPGEDSASLLVGFDKTLLAGLLDTFRPGLRDEVRSLIYTEEIGEAFNLPFPDLIQTRLVPALQHPPVTGAARSFWFESQVKELIALVCFRAEQKTEEFFCSRQKRLSIDRVSKTREYLQEHFEEPLDLNGIAEHVGCSSYYLSRTFSSITGMTISQYVRRLRVERAAELLLSGRYTVSEVAVEVGYNSQSHFSKAFQQEKGCLPSKYDAA